MKKLFLYIVILIIIFAGTFAVARHYFNERMQEAKTDKADYVADEEPSKETIVAARNKYIVGIKDGYVIVYLNDKDNVYEYTDIDASTLNITTPELYKHIKNTIEFEDKKDLFNFLENIAS